MLTRFVLTVDVPPEIAFSEAAKVLGRLFNAEVTEVEKLRLRPGFQEVFIASSRTLLTPENIGPNEIPVKKIDNRDPYTTWLWIDKVHYVEVNIIELFTNAIENAPNENSRKGLKMHLDRLQKPRS